MTTAYWSPNQVAVAQVETYTFTAPNSIGNTYTATINGKTVTYSSISGDTATTVATAMYALLTATDSVPPELLEVSFDNPSAGVMTATANAPGTPFANVTVDGVSGQGLVLSTGNGLANGITTVHTIANKSPSDVNDPQNWLRVTSPAPGVRQIPQNGDDEVVANTDQPMLWNLDRLDTVQRNSYQRWQSFTATIGLPENNPNGYVEWRATYYKMSGPAGSTPAGGLSMVLGFPTATGNGPTRERYDLGSQRFTLTVLGASSPQDDYGVKVLGQHTDNVINAHNGVSVGLATSPGEMSRVNTITCDGGATVGVGPGVTFSTNIFGTASTCTSTGGNLILNSPPATLTLNTGAQCTVTTDSLTFPIVSIQGGSLLSMIAGGIITSLTMTVGGSLDKSLDNRTLTITNSTIDGDSCQVRDPLNSIVWTNPTVVKQSVTSGPFVFTGSRTVRVV